MGVGRKMFTVLKVGEWLQEPDAVYYGGSPLAITTNGKLTLAKYGTLVATKTDSTAVTYVGVARNNYHTDSLTYQGQTTFFAGACIVTLMKGLPNTNNSSTNVEGTAGDAYDEYPYDTTLTWNEKDLVFVGHDGLWVNVNPASGKPCQGTVLTVGTNYITVLFYGGTNAVY